MLGIGAGLKAYDPKNMFAGAGAAMQTTAAAGISDMNAEDQDLRQMSAEQRARMRQLEDQAYIKKEKVAEEDRRYERLKETEGRTDKRNQANARFSAELPWTLERERNAKYRGVANAVTSAGTKGPEMSAMLKGMLDNLIGGPIDALPPADPYDDNPAPRRRSMANIRTDNRSYGLGRKGSR
jgi:hypothetical protein